MPDYSIYKELLNSGKLSFSKGTGKDSLSGSENDLDKLLELTASYRLPFSNDKMASWEKIRGEILKDITQIPRFSGKKGRFNTAF